MALPKFEPGWVTYPGPEVYRLNHSANTKTWLQSRYFKLIYIITKYLIYTFLDIYIYTFTMYMFVTYYARLFKHVYTYVHEHFFVIIHYNYISHKHMCTCAYTLKFTAITLRTNVH